MAEQDGHRHQGGAHTPAAVGRRYLSITFDDGLRMGTEIACDVLSRHRMQATFYVVTGWVHPAAGRISDVYNRGRDHGDWHYWRRVQAAGHEVGSHTFSHVNVAGKLAQLAPWLVTNELRRARDDIQRELGLHACTVSMPHNASSPQSERAVRDIYAACRLGTGHVAYARRGAFDRHRLPSWAPTSRTRTEEYRSAIAGIPLDGWLILQFHSFNGEGWEPITPETLDQICRLATEADIDVATVRHVVQEMAPCAA